ncbi:GtrA family protein [Actinacidiphila paucisporea]|uniref:Putative flippase GtrA (Transmembrane translocase of bactoprenol-linked glucose) n=1 Tax=Actinacidiphila paucisporea TaxID=310782 RepID=A0A1M7F853_9ACTN|nr:GtrA family protein [Actinacidiphila paucisporea]SHM00153.1 Putative flippase GtrA (transmembrane translocase of bactoprenol-linked glucose) [Actinacidiphila paucisporea]
MTGFSALRGKLALMYREIAKFGAVGGVGVLVNIGVFNLVRHSTGLQTVRASVLATLVSIAFNYLGFRYFTYRDRGKAGRTKELGRFLGFSCIGLVIENGVLFVATYGFDWDSQLQSNIFKFVGIGVATLFRFWSYRTWVFRAVPAGDPVEQAESFLTAGGGATCAGATGVSGDRRRRRKAGANRRV